MRTFNMPWRLGPVFATQIVLVVLRISACLSQSGQLFKYSSNLSVHVVLHCHVTYYACSNISIIILYNVTVGSPPYHENRDVW